MDKKLVVVRMYIVARVIDSGEFEGAMFMENPSGGEPLQVSMPVRVPADDPGSLPMLVLHAAAEGQKHALAMAKAGINPTQSPAAA